jgi:molybdopterin/thiamine biosynthesis adenylyltransferase
LFLILRCEILFINSKNIKIMQDKELERYSRHILLPEIEFEGQKKLLQSHCLIVGAGGLGSPVAIYLAASGVGKITICDFDSVDLSNLQRQIIHEENSIGLNKAESAKIALNRINSDINVVAIKKQLNIDEVKSMAEGRRCDCRLL